MTMASISSINSNSSGSQAPNPPPRIHSRPNKPPPPPPLPSVPPVPPTRESSMTISKSTLINGQSMIPQGIQSNQNMRSHSTGALMGVRFLGQFESMFKPIESLPPPEPFTNQPKSYNSQKVQAKQSAAPQMPS